MSLSNQTTNNNYPFLTGGGEAGELIRSIDWSQNPVGEPAGWPDALKISIGIILKSPFPMRISWGKELIIFYNDAYRPILGSLKHPQAMGKRLEEIFPEAWPVVGSMFLNVLQGETFRDSDFKITINRNGYDEECSFDFAYSPISDVEGNILGVMSTLIETTEKVFLFNENNRIKTDFEISEAESKKQRDTFKGFFMQAPAGICILSGPELIFEFINPTYQEILPGRNLLNRPVFEAIPELIGQPLHDILLNVYNTGQPYIVKELLIPLAKYEGGATVNRFFSFNYQPRLDKLGNVDGILVFAFEVTEQVNARLEVEKTEEMLRMAIDAAELGSYYINAADRIFMSSPRLKEFFGFGPNEEVPYEAAINQIHADYRQTVVDLVEAAITKGGRFDMEYPVIGYNTGKVRWVRGIGTLQHDSNGENSYFTGVLHEITEKKEDELRKNDFIAMVSHELKTPLTAIKGYLQILQAKNEKSEDSFTILALSKMNNQIRKMTGLINGFLDVSRLESGKISIEKHSFDIDALVDEIIEDARFAVSTHTIHFSSCKNEIKVHADRNKIESVISNLLHNAIKYSPDGKEIEVKCEAKNNEVIISIKDEGIGISPTDIDKLFERYYRVTTNDYLHIPGFGIGLYLCKEIIQRHGGKIWLESESGKGSTFYFSLPLAK